MNWLWKTNFRLDRVNNGTVLNRLLIFALFLLVGPIIGAILAWLIFAEGLNSTTWLALTVILSGIYLAQSSSATIHK